MKKEIINIDIDLIREMRRTGQSYEADKLYKAYRDDIIRQGKQAVNDCHKTDRLIKKSKGVCIQLGCLRMAVEGRAKCQRCLNLCNKSAKKIREKRER